MKKPSWRQDLPALAILCIAATGVSASSAGPGGLAGTVSPGRPTATAGLPDTPEADARPMGPRAAARLLMQGTFGATPETLNSAAGRSYTEWFAAQAAAPPSLTLPAVTANDTDWSRAWFNNVVLGRDQLRQRMAFALSEILVVSGGSGALFARNRALAGYYDLLTTGALGNFRALLEAVTRSPAMGLFLSLMRSDKPDPATGVHADQNYAREVMQLFTIGPVRLNLDGTVVTDGAGNPIPAYTLNDVIQLSNALTGWASAPSGHTGEQAWRYDLDETAPMVPYENHHDRHAKVIIGGVRLPEGRSAAADLKTALDTLFNHPNAGPFIGRQLIQRLVTSNPSPAYVRRVAGVFNNDGAGVRGNLLAVARAILTDPEAVTPGDVRTYGRVREPLLRITSLWRAFDARSPAGQAVDGRLMIYAGAWLAQYPLAAPSVFNFFEPGYHPGGRLSQAALVAPELQITNEATVVTTANALRLQSYQYIDGKGAVHAGADYDMTGALGSDSVLLHTAPWEPLAADPDRLAGQLDQVLMAGQMSAGMREVLVRYAASIPADEAGARVVETAALLLGSPEYAVQR